MIVRTFDDTASTCFVILRSGTDRDGVHCGGVHRTVGGIVDRADDGGVVAVWFDDVMSVHCGSARRFGFRLRVGSGGGGVHCGGVRRTADCVVDSADGGGVVSRTGGGDVVDPSHELCRPL